MTATVEQTDIVPYSSPSGLERVKNPQQGDQAWFDMAIGNIRELRTLFDGIWVPDSELQESGL